MPGENPITCAEFGCYGGLHQIWQLVHKTWNVRHLSSFTQNLTFLIDHNEIVCWTVHSICWRHAATPTPLKRQEASGRSIPFKSASAPLPRPDDRSSLIPSLLAFNTLIFIIVFFCMRRTERAITSIRCECVVFFFNNEHAYTRDVTECTETNEWEILLLCIPELRVNNKFPRRWRTRCGVGGFMPVECRATLPFSTVSTHPNRR